MSNHNSISEQIKAERSFIHDLASPLMIAHGMCEAILSTLDPDDPNYSRLEKSVKALAKMSDTIRDRRQQLIDQTKQIEG